MSMFPFRLPDIGEGVAEGEVVAWHVEPGQHVVEDQDMVEIMTDKATVTIGAPRAGRIAQLNANVGERVLVGSVLVVIDTSDASEAHSRHEPRASRPSETDTARSRFQAPASSLRSGARLGEVPAPREVAAAKPRASEGGQQATAASAVGDIRETLPGASFFSRQSAREHVAASVEPRTVRDTMPAAPPQQTFFEAKPLATPATRKLARDLGVTCAACRPPVKAGASPSPT